jgi:hypothetical protein
MTSETIEQPEAEQAQPDAEQAPAEPQEIVAESVFLVIKDANGNFGVSTDINAKLSVSTIATIADIRNGCRDISNIINARELAKMVADSLQQQQ